MHKGILLDIDNTLYTYEPVHQQALNAVFELIKKQYSINQEEVKQALSIAKREVKQDTAETAASHNRLLYMQKLCEKLELDSLQFSLLLYETYWQHFLDNMDLSKGAQVFLKASQEYPICLVTDLTAHIQHRKIEKLQLYHWADKMVTSEEAGCEKPHPYMFLLAMNKLALQASDVCMIGDNYTKDILGAARLGIQSFWLNENQDPLPSTFDSQLMTQIHSLEELPWV